MTRTYMFMIPFLCVMACGQPAFANESCFDTRALPLSVGGVAVVCALGFCGAGLAWHRIASSWLTQTKKRLKMYQQLVEQEDVQALEELEEKLERIFGEHLRKGDFEACFTKLHALRKGACLLTGYAFFSGAVSAAAGILLALFLRRMQKKEKAYNQRLGQAFAQEIERREEERTIVRAFRWIFGGGPDKH